VFQPPPWQEPALADTALALEFGITSATGDTSGTLFEAALAPVRRGPLRLGFGWDFIWVRTGATQEFGFGDPKVFARLRVLGGIESPVVFHAEGSARLPTAKAKLFPFASGGQEIELAGTLSVGRARHSYIGAGYIWSEPPGGSALRASDVPHALHVYAAAAVRAGSWVLRSRADAFRMEENHERAELEVSATRLAPRALHPTLVVGAGFGDDDERVYNVMVALRVAMELRSGRQAAAAAPAAVPPAPPESQPEPEAPLPPKPPEQTKPPETPQPPPPKP
jgi:hypothetical protein